MLRKMRFQTITTLTKTSQGLTRRAKPMKKEDQPQTPMAITSSIKSWKKVKMKKILPGLLQPTKLTLDSQNPIKTLMGIHNKRIFQLVNQSRFLTLQRSISNKQVILTNSTIIYRIQSDRFLTGRAKLFMNASRLVKFATKSSLT